MLKIIANTIDIYLEVCYNSNKLNGRWSSPLNAIKLMTPT